MPVIYLLTVFSCKELTFPFRRYVSALPLLFHCRLPAYKIIVLIVTMVNTSDKCLHVILPEFSFAGYRVPCYNLQKFKERYK